MGRGHIYSFGDLLNRSFKLGHGSIVPLDINDIQGMGFLGNLVQIITNTVKLLCHGIIVCGRRILRHKIIDKMAKISATEIWLRLAFFCRFSASFLLSHT